MAPTAPTAQQLRGLSGPVLVALLAVVGPLTQDGGALEWGAAVAVVVSCALLAVRPLDGWPIVLALTADAGAEELATVLAGVIFVTVLGQQLVSGKLQANIAALTGAKP